MYYRISFSAWLNAHRKDKALKAKQAGIEGMISPRYYLDKMNEGDREVDIEVEEIVEYTSDEDEVVTPVDPEEEDKVSESLKQEKMKKVSARSSVNRSGIMGKRNKS